MSTLDAPSQLDSTPDLWHVRLPSGEVRTMSLDALDTAFQDGHVDEETLVCQAGATQWAPLRELAGLDDAPTARHSNGAQNSAQNSAQSVAPQTPSPFAVDVPSVRPVAADLDLDIPLARDEGFRPTIKRKTVVAVAISLGVLLGVVLAITKADGTPDPAVAAAGVGVAVDSTLPPIVAAPKAPDPPAATATPPTSADANAPGARLSSDQRKALLEVDKAHAQQHKARSAPSHAASRSNSKPVFHKGGSKGDPLNSSI